MKFVTCSDFDINTSLSLLGQNLTSASAMAYFVPSVDTRIEIIAQRLANTEENFRQQRMPGLQAVLNDYINPNIDTDIITEITRFYV